MAIKAYAKLSRVVEAEVGDKVLLSRTEKDSNSCIEVSVSEISPNGLAFKAKHHDSGAIDWYKISWIDDVLK